MQRNNWDAPSTKAEQDEASARLARTVLALARGFSPMLMTKEQADMFGLNNDPI